VYRLFSLYTGTVQVLQYRYQAALLYKKRALGQSRLLDTTNDLPNKGTFWLLIVFLTLAYVCPGAVGTPGGETTEAGPAGGS
jgi:hypothetical protein